MTARAARYEKLAEIASGGMATVHLGRTTGVGGFERFVAIKEMHPHLAREQDFVKMFLDEARLAARIHHPNVVATIDVTETGDEEAGLALVMEFVEGPTLQQLLRHASRNHLRIPLDVALRIFLDTLAGLDAAHELKDADGTFLNLVHRDVSPQNILVGAEGITKITDFGVARAESRLSTTRTGSVKGKVPYMSPEQIRSRPVDRRTDIYAAGVCLWEMLTSRRLVTGDSEVAMIFQVTDRPSMPPHDIIEEVPEPISRICERALSKSAEDRFATAGDFAEALEIAARESGITIASTRAVSAYVRGLALHRVPADLAGESKKKSDVSPRSERLSAEIVSRPGTTRAQTAVITDAPVEPEPTPKKGAFSRVHVIVGVIATLGVAAGVLLIARGPTKNPAPEPDRAPTAAAADTAGGAAAAGGSATTDSTAGVQTPPPVASASASTSMSAQPVVEPNAAPSSSAKPAATGKGKTFKGGYRPREL